MVCMALAKSQDLQFLPLWVAVVPLVTINISYLVAVGTEHLPACIPYLSGCTSVSATGRVAPESLIFKAGMLSSAVAFALLWHRSATFLQTRGQRPSRVLLLRIFSLLAALSLTLYAVTLGLKGDEFRVLRRIGIDGFAFSNLIIEVLFIVFYRSMRIETTHQLFRWLVVLCIAMPLLGIAAELAKWLGAPRRPTNNLVAWNAFVVFSAYYVVIARIWWHHGIAGGRAASPSE
jgi:hypothetical protein